MKATMTPCLPRWSACRICLLKRLPLVVEPAHHRSNTQCSRCGYSAVLGTVPFNPHNVRKIVVAS